MITGKEVVLSGQVRGIFFLLAFLWLLSCLCPDVLLHSQVALALFVVGKVGAWFTSLGLLYTGAPASFWGVPLCADSSMEPYCTRGSWQTRAGDTRYGFWLQLV